MLKVKNLENKSYEEMIAQARMEIPLYTDEWTNFNPSDPGVTILENLTAFEALQQNHINQISPGVQKNLLKMAGFEAQKGRCARVLLEPDDMGSAAQVEAGEKFYLGDLCFEAGHETLAGACHMTGIYSQIDGVWQDQSLLLKREIRVPFYIFGKDPKAGDSLWLMADQLPGPGAEWNLYVTVADRYNRNAFSPKGSSRFAKMKWECYTVDGFQEMKVKDLTGGFLVSGEIRLRMPESPAAVCQEAPEGGYAVRVTLTRADYDVRPKLMAVDAFLFEAWQRDTRAGCYTFNRISSASLSKKLIGDGYPLVFCKETKGSSYRRYTEAQEGKKSRFFQVKDGEGRLTWLFDQRRFGYGPEKLKNAIKIVIYQEEMMRQYYLGTVLGYDKQSMKLPAGNLVPESFVILAERVDEQGESIFDFVKPNRGGENDLTYYVYEKEGRIEIEDAGDFIGARLYVGALAVTRGEQGNIRAGNTLRNAAGMQVYNPAAGTGGRLRESLEDVRDRFLEDLKRPYTAVTAKDYERLVLETPELCIHKVHAYPGKQPGTVCIAVKPGTDEEFPELSPIYQAAIEERLEERRLLTTRIQVVSPVYLPIDVHASIGVKRQYSDSRKRIENCIRRELDGVHSEKQFGEPVRFSQLFHALEQLDCVESVYELSISPRSYQLARLTESDILPAQNCLCYAGEIVLETGTGRVR